jgi:hypothetical protein
MHITPHLHVVKDFYIFKSWKIKYKDFKYEFLNIYISHFAQLGMINITFKC